VLGVSSAGLDALEMRNTLCPCWELDHDFSVVQSYTSHVLFLISLLYALY
jgi:hypothetical protein